MESLRVLTSPPPDGAGRCTPLAGGAAMPNNLVALVALAAFVVAASGCAEAEGTYKAREKDPNAGGGSMYRAVDPAGRR